MTGKLSAVPPRVTVAFFQPTTPGRKASLDRPERDTARVYSQGGVVFRVSPHTSLVSEVPIGRVRGTRHP